MIDETTPVKADLCINWVHNRNFMEYHWSNKVGDTVTDAESGIIGWDPVKGQLVDWRCMLSGKHSIGTVEITDEKIIRHFGFITPNGETKKGAILLWGDDINTIRWQNARIDDKGGAKPEGEPVVYKRVLY